MEHFLGIAKVGLSPLKEMLMSISSMPHLFLDREELATNGTCKVLALVGAPSRTVEPSGTTTSCPSTVQLAVRPNSCNTTNPLLDPYTMH